MAQDCCQIFPTSRLQQVLKPKTFEMFEKRQQDECLIGAGIELFECPGHGVGIRLRVHANRLPCCSSTNLVVKKTRVALILCRPLSPLWRVHTSTHKTA